ncbi:MAG TPA: hypothetical protein DDW45_02750 [Gammaproteobacteria bacterium]|nr:hypothetical protein [Gammaproteobacteria bacterium]
MSETALLISNKYPFPCDDGKKTVLAGLLSYLLERYGTENVCYIVIGEKPETTLHAPGCRLIWMKPPGRLMQVTNLVGSLLGFNSRSMQESMTYSPRLQHSLVKLAGELEPTLMVLDTLRIGQYFHDQNRPGCRRILYMDDLFYLRYQRMLKAAEDGIRYDPTGTFAAFLPPAARTLLNIRGIQKLLYRIEMNKIEHREIESTGFVDLSLLINPNEVQTLQERHPPGPVRSIKPLLYQESCKVERSYDGAPVFLMFGSLRHPVYRASVINFLECCMEKIIREMPDVRIRVVGGGADDQIVELASQYGEHVDIAGFIPDLDSVFATSCALLIPIIAAGGLKIKTITALYYGLPVIATDHGVDGIPLTEEDFFIRENEIDRFPMHMKRLCDTTYNREISRNASRTYQNHYAKNRVYEEYRELFG